MGCLLAIFFITSFVEWSPNLMTHAEAVRMMIRNIALRLALLKTIGGTFREWRKTAATAFTELYHGSILPDCRVVLAPCTDWAVLNDERHGWRQRMRERQG